MNEIYGHFQFSYCSAQSILLHLRRHKRTGGTITVACSWLLLNIVIRFNEIAWVVILMPEKVLEILVKISFFKKFACKGEQRR